MSTPDTKPSNSDSDLPPSQTPTQQSDSPADAKPEDEEEGFCLYMKGGGCRDSFIDLEKCIEAAEKNNEDIEDKCDEVIAKLRVCMEAHADYYEPIFRIEKAVEKQFVDELEKVAGTAGQTADQSGFCLYMKGGGCRDSFIDLKKCVKAAEKNNEDIEDKCDEVAAKLWVCMEAHADYYEPIFRIEKAVEKQLVDELEKLAGTAEQTADQSASQSKEASKDSAKEAASNDK